MSAQSLVLVVGLVLLGIAVSPRVAAWLSRDAASESLRSELEALEKKKELLRALQDGDPQHPGMKQPPAA